MRKDIFKMILRGKVPLAAVKFGLAYCVFKKRVCAAAADFAAYKRCVYLCNHTAFCVNPFSAAANRAFKASYRNFTITYNNFHSFYRKKTFACYYIIVARCAKNVSSQYKLTRIALRKQKTAFFKFHVNYANTKFAFDKFYLAKLII